MLVLLDENVPHQVRIPLAESGHAVHTLQHNGWIGVKNGELLDLAEAKGYEVIVTFDKNMWYQNNFAVRNIACVLLTGKESHAKLRIREIDSAVRAARPALLYEVALT